MSALDFSKLSRLLAWILVVSSIFGIVFMLMNRVESIGLFQFVSLLIGSLVYLILDNKREMPTCSQLPPKVFVFSSWLLFSVASFILLIKDTLSRGILFFILVSTSISILLLFGLNSTRIRNLSHVSLSVLLTLFISTFYLGGIFQYQEDPGMYMDWSQSIIQTGHVISNVFGRHAGIPNYNIWQAEVILVGNIDILQIQIFSTVILSFLFLMLVYLVYINMTHDQKLSYVGTILAFIYPVTLKWSYVQDSRAFAMIFVLLGILYAQRFLKLPRSEYILLLLISWATILNTHYFYSVVFVLFVFVPLFILVIVDRILNIYIIPTKTISITILLSIVTYIGKVAQYKKILNIFVKGLLLILALGHVKNLVIESSAISLQGLMEYFAFLLYLSLIVMGSLVYLREIKLDATNNLFTLFLVGASLAITPVILKIGMFVLNPKRLLYFLGIIFGFLSAISVHTIYKRIQNKKSKVTIVFIIIFLLTFTSLTSNLSNQMDPVFYGTHYPILFFHTESERSMTFFIDRYLMPNVSILSDYRTISKGAVPLGWNKSRVIRIENISQIKDFNGYVVFSRISINKSFLLKIGPGYGPENVPLSTIRKEIYINTLNRDKIFDGVIVVYSQREVH